MFLQIRSVSSRVPLLVCLLAIWLLPSLGQEKSSQSKSGDAKVTKVPGQFEIDEHFPEAWKQFSSADGGLSILFPGTPEELKQTHNPEDEKRTIRRFQLITDIALYEVNYSQYATRQDSTDNLEKTLDGLRDNAVKNSRGKLISESDQIFDGHPSRYIVLRAEGGIIIKGKYILFGNRIYSIVFATPEQSERPGTDEAFKESIAKKFFESFKFSSDKTK